MIRPDEALPQLQEASQTRLLQESCSTCTLTDIYVMSRNAPPSGAARRIWS